MTACASKLSSRRQLPLMSAQAHGPIKRARATHQACVGACTAVVQASNRAGAPLTTARLCTHVCAGTVLGANHGVARNAILHPVKVMAADGSGSYSNIISAMGW